MLIPRAPLGWVLGWSEVLRHGSRGEKAQSEMWEEPELVQGSPGLRQGWGHGVLRLLDVQALLGVAEEQRRESGS